MRVMQAHVREKRRHHSIALKNGKGVRSHPSWLQRLYELVGGEDEDEKGKEEEGTEEQGEPALKRARSSTDLTADDERAKVMKGRESGKAKFAFLAEGAKDEEEDEEDEEEDDDEEDEEEEEDEDEEAE